MKIIFNKKVVHGPWGGGNQILKLFQGYLVRRGHQVSYELTDDADVVIIMDVKESSCSFSMNSLRKFKDKTGIRVIHRINDNGSHRKNNVERSDNLMIDINRELADETIFISQWLKDYYVKRGLKVNNSYVIVNGTDRGLFYPGSNVVRLHNEPVKIITHHWSSNMSKGFSIYDELDKFCYKNSNIAQFKFLGNCPDGMLKMCNKISLKPYTEIPFYLMSQDVYVTATQFESGGCHVIEGMACGLIPVVRYGGGGTEEYSRGFGYYFNDFEELKNSIIDIYKNYDLFLDMRNKVRNNYIYSAKEMCEKYLNVIKG